MPLKWIALIGRPFFVRAKTHIKMPKIGRPTEFNENTVKMVEKYIKDDFKKDEIVPTITGLAIYLGITRQTIYDWSSKNEEFSDIMGILMTTQEKRLLSGSLTNKLNTKIATLMLVKHGYKKQFT